LLPIANLLKRPYLNLHQAICAALYVEKRFSSYGKILNRGLWKEALGMKLGTAISIRDFV
jgi:hypothetical protein